MSGQCEECKKICDRCEDKAELNSETRDDYYNFKEEQIARNTACTLQLSQHDKEITGIKKHSANCGSVVLPAISKNLNRLLGSAGFISLLFMLVMFYVKGVSAKAIIDADQAEDTRADVAIIKNDMKYIKRDVGEMRADMKAMVKSIQSYIEMDNRRDAKHDN